MKRTRDLDERSPQVDPLWSGALWGAGLILFIFLVVALLKMLFGS